MKKIILFLIAIIILAGVWYWQNKNQKQPEQPNIIDYIIEGQKTSVFGEPVYDKDTAYMFLVVNSEGSGTFYYAGAATKDNGNYKASNTIFLGDRIAPQNININNGIAAVNYADRKITEPMTTPPSIGITKYVYVENGSLVEIKLSEVGEQLFYGDLVMGEGARSFKPCGEKEPLWVIGNSPAYQALMQAFQENASEIKPYTPVFVVLTGKITTPPKDGFGTDYKNAITVNQLVKILSDGKCQ